MNHVFQHMKDNALSIEKHYLDKFPIPDPPDLIREEIMDVCEELIIRSASKTTNDDFIKYEEALSNLVYKAYDLSENEISIIERNLPPRDPIIRMTV